VGGAGLSLPLFSFFAPVFQFDLLSYTLLFFLSLLSFGSLLADFSIVLLLLLVLGF
jgi:hypothetical protein